MVKKMFASNDTYKEKYSLISTAEVYNGCAIACTDESTRMCVLPRLRQQMSCFPFKE
ncbi:MAG: hypothetical protein ACLSCV_06195 [Acutalibacteraceae bacterium]